MPNVYSFPGHSRSLFSKDTLLPPLTIILNIYTLLLVSQTGSSVLRSQLISSNHLSIRKNRKRYWWQLRRRNLHFLPGHMGWQVKGYVKGISILGFHKESTEAGVGWRCCMGHMVLLGSGILLLPREQSPFSL